MAEPISLDHFRKKKAEESNRQTHFGKMIWLSCPKCKKIEYTEIIAPNGRRHSCGMQVEEVEVELDLRAEATITLHNLTKLQEMLDQPKGAIRKLINKALDNALQQLKLSEEIYLDRLKKASKTPLIPYEGEEEVLQPKLPIKEVNSLGLWISEFRYNPEQRFQK